MKMLPVLVVMLMIVLLQSGCHTIQGVGKDIQRGGEAIERTGQ